MAWCPRLTSDGPKLSTDRGGALLSTSEHDFSFQVRAKQTKIRAGRDSANDNNRIRHFRPVRHHVLILALEFSLETVRVREVKGVRTQWHLLYVSGDALAAGERGKDL